MPFIAAHPIGATDITALPVKEVAPAIAFYVNCLGFALVGKTATTAQVKRDAVVLGLAVNGADPDQASVYVHVDQLETLHLEYRSKLLYPTPIGPSSHAGREYRVFWAKEPYGVCFCFGLPI